MVVKGVKIIDQFLVIFQFLVGLIRLLKLINFLLVTRQLLLHLLVHSLQCLYALIGRFLLRLRRDTLFKFERFDFALLLLHVAKNVRVKLWMQDLQGS